MDRATQVSQQSTRYQGHEAELVVNEAELVGTSSSNIYFKLAKTLDALDVVQGTAEDKVVGVRRGTRQSPKQGQVRGRGTGYTSKSKTLKLSTIKDLSNGVRWS